MEAALIHAATMVAKVAFSQLSFAGGLVEGRFRPASFMALAASLAFQRPRIRSVSDGFGLASAIPSPGNHANGLPNSSLLFNAYEA
ncbi:hypothetical protein A200_01801 [Parascardovia denticolens IPLA 20019]|uniref:Uncharacterized protein n=1 Tax=Parascardovia denticolens DSM 10105 = JCM 12538 TaxID=864564 RepID=E6K0M2_PARDN|nr:hypothetical protein [Parascardovia denticolens]EFT83360.1 hypothetical protein HMPREF0620_0365 [Parascardovia denticolens DSM 10105 = JCM 12538]EIT88633.1 hypothetical protein A200_01801 [Parascardovia denticolens IPLA 20019]BAR05745.1 hypothetical protein PSDT_1226 [Parascardovia denticolens DSM 10105 = JCM 12538]